MSKPAILYILHSYFNTAGTEEHVRLLCKELKDTFECFITAPFRDKIILLHNEDVIQEFPIEPLPWPVVPEKSPRHSEVLQEIKKIVRPALVHIQHTMHWHLEVITDLSQWGIPLVMSFHDYFAITPHFTMQGITDPRVTLGPNYAAHYFGHDISQYLRSRRTVITESFKHLVVRIVPSHYLQDTLSVIFPGQYEIVEHGIERFIPLPISKREQCAFGYIGSLLPQKGYAVLLDAFERFRTEFPHSVLYMYGGGEAAQQRPLPGVIYKGHYTAADLPQILSTFDIGIIPSVFAETFCLTLSELWMGGKPVLASKIGALSERIIEGINGKFFIPGNSEDLMQGMKWFYTNLSWKDWTLPIVRGGDRMAKDYQAIYNRLLTV